MSEARQRLIVALDVASVEEARRLIDQLGDAVGVYKIGLELLFSGGVSLARELADRGVKIFADAKLLDIEATVERATAAIARLGAHFLTVHALDRKTLEAAVRGRGESPLKLLGVTVLTNLEAADLVQQGIDHAPKDLVLHRAKLAREAGFDGVVASVWEAAAARVATSGDFTIVTPGIRPAESQRNDQARIATPAEAIAAGADYLVVGRPIIAAADPRKAALAIGRDMAQALQASPRHSGAL